MLDIEQWMDLLEGEQESTEGSVKIHKLEKEVKKSRKKNLELIHMIEILEAREQLLLNTSIPQELETPILPWTKSSVAEATAVVLASDWHVEEVVDPLTINGLNEYNPSIAKKRARNFFRALLWKIRSARCGESKEYGFHIENLVLWLGGDMISGYIHEELMESNAMSPTEAILFCSSLICTGINFLLEEGGLKRIIVPCSFGNHSRTTIKRRHSTGAKNSFEWLMYHQLKKIYENETRIEFLIADGAHLYLDIYDWTIRFHHGDDINGLGSLQKSLDSWNMGKYADLTAIGHWHQFRDENFAVINGSLVGHGPFSQSIKARYEPPRQAFFLMDKERGKIDVSPLYVEESQNRMPSGKIRL